MSQNCNSAHNKKMELTTKAEPILGEFKDLGGFCVSSFRRQKYRQIVTCRAQRQELLQKNCQALTDKYGYSKEGKPVEVFAWLFLILLFVHVGLIAVPAVLFLISFSANASQEKKLKAWNDKKEEWEKRNPDPPNSVLKHFHDPQAQLTEKDRKVLKVFNNWPGYPPFWKYLREVVLNRDGNHCQVSGCSSRVTLHVHHQTPVSTG